MFLCILYNTILFIAHNLSVVKYFSDRIGVMYRGKLLEIADSDDLYEHPIHPYTKSLLSAIPQPDPLYEKKRVRTGYEVTDDYWENSKFSYHEIYPQHFVYATDEEAKEYMKNKL